MSELQIGLIALGILVVVLVLLFNWWQDRRARKSIQDTFGDQADALIPDAIKERREPGMSPILTDAMSTEADLQHDAEEADDATEAVIDVSFPEPITGSELSGHLQSIRFAGQKPIRLFAETDGGFHHASLRPDLAYQSVQVAVLLANRSGALTRSEWEEALSRARILADRFDGNVETPDADATLKRAAEVDALCASMDVHVGLTLVSNSRRWSSSDILSAAREAGFSAMQHGSLPWLDQNGVLRFSLTRTDGASMAAVGEASIHQLTLLLDVPKSLPAPDGFNTMAKVARVLAARLDATVVDDSGKVLMDGAEQGVDRQLQGVYGRLDEAGLAAGSNRALRVFS